MSALIAGVILGVGVPAHGDVATLAAVADVSLNKGAANKNQNDDPTLRIRKSALHRVLIRFDTSAMAAAVGVGTLEKAELRLFLENTANIGTGRVIAVHRVTEAWGETSATWNCPDDSDPSNSAPDCPAQWDGGSFLGAATDEVLHTADMVGTRVAFDVTPDVRSFLAGTANYGWILLKRDETQGGTLDYTPREGVAGQQPELVLTVRPPLPSDCLPTPATGCLSPVEGGKSRLVLRARPGKPRSRKVVWRWRAGAATDLALFGDPLGTTDYRLCVYDESGGTPVLVGELAVPAGNGCGGAPCWQLARKGFKYKASTLEPDGVRLLRLRPGDDGKASIVLRASGENAPLFSLPLAQDPTVVVQLRNGLGNCWESRFSAPAILNEVRPSGVGIFKDVSDEPGAPTPTPTPTTPTGPTPTPTPTPLPGFDCFDYQLGPNSLAVVKTALLSLNLPLTGSLRLCISQTEDADGTRQVIVPAAGVHIDPVPVNLLGIAYACIDVPADGTGFIDCDGGTPGIDLAVRQDHNTTPGSPGNSGSAAGLPDDPECDDTSTFRGTTTQACLEGSPCDDDGTVTHAGVCNSPLVTTGSGTFAPGDLQVTFTQGLTTLGTGDLGPDGEPCTADDTATPADPVTTWLGTGTTTATIFDSGSSAGNTLQSAASGAPGSCADPAAGMSVAGGFVAVDAPAAIVLDIVTTFTLELVPAP